MHQYFSNLDFKVFLALNNLTGHPWADWFFVLCAVYFAFIMPAILIIWWFVAEDRISARKAILLAGLAALVARYGIKTLIATFWSRNRPFIAHTVHDIISKKDNQASFPSGHAIAMFAIASAVYAYNKKMGILMYTMATLTGICRIVVGVHYPSDIIAGAVLGALTGYLLAKVLDKRIDPLTQSISNLSNQALPFTKSK
ncbi:MAG: bcrC [Candidatus Doudnabacteria bacterium]|nr:bcrC [Candidatus Doudnabacteria bacterium]